MTCVKVPGGTLLTYTCGSDQRIERGACVEMWRSTLLAWSLELDQCTWVGFPPIIISNQRSPESYYFIQPLVLIPISSFHHAIRPVRHCLNNFNRLPKRKNSKNHKKTAGARLTQLNSAENKLLLLQELQGNQLLLSQNSNIPFLYRWDDI